jgi:hypothetical protein
VRHETWAVPLVLGVLMFAVVSRMERPKRPAPKKAAAPVTSYVEPPIPPEAPWGPLTQPNSDLPAAVDDVLARKCRRCHAVPARHSAPFPLFTWADTRGERNGEPIYQRLGKAVATGFMPNMIPANPPIEALTEAEKQTLIAWVSAGAPSASQAAKTISENQKKKPRTGPVPSGSKGTP